MKNKKLLIALFAVVICISSLSVLFHTAATEPNKTVTPSEMYSKELIYTEFANNKVAETTLASSDWYNFSSYSNSSSNWSAWEDKELFTLPCNLTTYYRTTDAKEPKGAIIYVVGHLEPRVGTESDVDIIDSYLNEGYIVVVCDFLENENAVSPYIDCSAAILRYELSNKKRFVEEYYTTYIKYDTFVLPAGYRKVRDIVYFDINESAAKGTYEQIVTAYNTDLTKTTVNNAGGTWVEAKTIDDIIMPNGYPLNDSESGNRDKFMKYRLDIYYPSIPGEGVEVPVFAFASSNYMRTQFNPTDVSDRLVVAGALFGGYALAVYDHEYTPFMLGRDSWKHINKNFSLQSANGVKTHTAAIRCIKYYSDVYGYSNEKIGVSGHSKASYAITLSGPNPDKFYESSVYSEQSRGENYGEQPYLTYKDGTPISSDVTCVYHSMGAGSINRHHFLTPSNVPTYIACGVLDNANPAPRDYWEQEFKDYQAIGIPFAASYMPEVGHTYPTNTADPIYGYNYYKSVRAFFDYYLKGTAPKVMYTGIEAGGTVDISDKGLFIYFSAPITEWSLLKSVSVTDGNGNAVAGTWLADCGGMRWVFKTDAFVEGADYTLTLNNTAADINGMELKDGIVRTFEVK